MATIQAAEAKRAPGGNAAKAFPTELFAQLERWMTVPESVRPWFPVTGLVGLAAFPAGLDFRAHELVAEDDWVALDMQSDGRHVSGRRYHNRYTYWIQVRDGTSRPSSRSRRAKAREENLAMLAAAIDANGPLRYDEVRLAPIPGGFVQQHVVRSRALVLPAVVVCQTPNGRITRLDEYFDSAQVAGA